MSNRVCAWISYGQFGPVADPVSGLRALVQRCKAIGINTMHSPYQWDQWDTIVHEVNDASDDVKIAVGGASLGDCESIQIAQNTKRDIDLLFGFQRSEYGYQGKVPRNVIKAIEIYNPIWIETGGLGDDPWQLEQGNTRTILRNIPIEAPHPDDFGVAQDIVFNYLKGLL